MERKMVMRLLSFAWVLVLLVLMPVSPAAAETGASPSGAVTETDVPADAIHVTVADALHSALSDNAAYIVIDKDLELGTWDAVAEFSGVLDGQGHTLTITGFTLITGEWSDKWGFLITNKGTIRDLCFRVDVEQLYSYDSAYGGVIAYSNEGVIERCGTIGSLGFTCLETGYTFAGFVASNEGSGIIRDCYSSIGLHMVIESGYQQGGGSYGFTSYNSGTIERCWSTASKSGGTKRGAYFCADNRGTMADCFTCWEHDGDDKSVPVVSTSAMKQRDTYANWNFGSVWYIHPDINNGYPVLRTDRRWTDWVDNPKIYELALDRDTVTMGTGESCTLELTMTPGPLDVADPRVYWSSSDTGVAFVTQDGLVRGVGEGTADISVYSLANPDASAVCVFEVERSADALKLEDLTLERGASGTPTLTIYPADADTEMVWSIEDTRIASIDAATGQITALDIDGSTKVSVTAVRGGKKATALLTVRSSVTGLDLLDSADGTRLNDGVLALLRWQNKTVSPQLTPAIATVTEVVWDTSKPGIVSVDNGILTGNGAGEAVITATADNGAVMASFTVKVRMPGDLNNDNLADDKDAQIALDAASGLQTLTPDQISLGDVTGDGKVNEDDAVKILQYARGKISSLIVP